MKIQVLNKSWALADSSMVLFCLFGFICGILSKPDFMTLLFAVINFLLTLWWLRELFADGIRIIWR